MADVVWCREKLEGLQWPSREIETSLLDRDNYLRLKATDAGAAGVVQRTITVFLVADRIVGQHFEAVPQEDLNHEINCVFVLQEAQEIIHEVVYAKVADIVLPEVDRAEAQTWADQHPAIQDVVAWAKHHTQNGATYEKIAARVAFELCLFTSLFVVPHVLRKTCAISAFIESNETISRDETFHVKSGAIILGSAFREAPAAVRSEAAERLREIFQSAATACKKTIEWVFQGERIGAFGYASAVLWLEYNVDEVMRMLGEYGLPCDPLYRHSRDAVPEWLFTIGTVSDNQRPNFFETKALQYSMEFPENAFRLVAGTEELAQETAAARALLARGGRPVAEVIDG